MTVFTQRDTRVVANILRDVAQAEIMPRFRGTITQEVRQKTASYEDLLIFAHVSFSVTVRLKTGLPGAESFGSTKK